MPIKKKQDGNPLECGCGRSFRTVGGLTAHCEAKGHPLVLVSQFHGGRTVVNNYVFRNTSLQVDASENGYSIRRLDGNSQANSAEGPRGGVSSFPAVNNIVCPYNVPQSVPQGVQLWEREGPEVKIEDADLSPPTLPPTSPRPIRCFSRVRQTRPNQFGRWSCPYCKEKFLRAKGCYKHCLATHHRCCPYIPVQAWSSHLEFRKHLVQVHGQSEEPLLGKHEDKNTCWHARAKTKFQTNANHGQNVAQNSQAPSTLPPAPSSLPAKPRSRVAPRQEAPVPRESPRESRKPGVLASGGQTAGSQEGSTSNVAQDGQESKALSTNDGTVQGTSASGNQETEKENESAAAPAQSTTRPAPVSVASIWRGLDVSKMRGKRSYIELDEEDS